MDPLEDGAVSLDLSEVSTPVCLKSGILNLQLGVLLLQVLGLLPLGIQRGLESQLLLVVAFLQPPLLLSKVQLLLLEVDDRLLGVLKSGQDIIHLGHLLLGPVSLQFLELCDLGIKNTFDRLCHVPFIGFVKVTNLLLFNLQSLVVLLLDLSPDLVLIHHLLGGGDRLEVEVGQAVNEPGLLLLDGDPGIVLLGVNQGRLSATSARLEVLDFNFQVGNLNLLQPELLLELAQPVPVVSVILGQDGDLRLHPGKLLLLLCILLEHSLILMVLRHAMDIKATTLADPVHIDTDLGIPGVKLDLVDVSLQPVIKLMQAHAPGVASASGVGGRGVGHRPPRLLIRAGAAAGSPAPKFAAMG